MVSSATRGKVDNVSFLKEMGYRGGLTVATACLGANHVDLSPEAHLRIPMKSPLRTEMMSSPDSDMMSPPGTGAALAF